MSDSLNAYLLLDTSASMSGAPLEALKQGLQLLCGTFISRSKRPVRISVIRYESTARELMPLSDVNEFGTLDMGALDAGGSSGMGGALRLAMAHLPDDSPNVFYVFTDGEPTDDWESAVQALRPHISKIYGLICGLIADPKQTSLAAVVDDVFRLQDLTPDRLFDTFRSLL